MLILNNFTQINLKISTLNSVQLHNEAPHLGDDPSVDFWEAQMNFELGMQEKAFEAFDCLYRKFKKRPFKGHDSKYLDFYLSNLKK